MAICKLCGNEYASEHSSYHFHYLYEYACPVCGMYAIEGNLSAEFYEKAKFIAFEKRLRQEDAYLIHDREENQLDALKKHFSNKYSLIHWKEFIKEFPKNHEIPDRALLNLEIATQKRFGQSVELNPIIHQLSRVELKTRFPAFLLFADKDNFRFVIESLRENCYITAIYNPEGFFNVTITAEGWNRIAELKAASAENSDKAFIAMWFSDETEPIRAAVRKAIEEAGYIPQIVDEIPHTDFIMNKVINLINESKFVIADFTTVKEHDGKTSSGVRGGVYFEAGYARGQGKHVIQTCRKGSDYENRMHFDIKQINTIFWNADKKWQLLNKEEFIDDLKQAIWVLVGKGPKL